MDYQITTITDKSDHYERITFRAQNKDGFIFGADADLYRRTDFKGNWEAWKINYGSCGEDTYEGKMPHVAAINAAMEKLKELSI